MKAPRWYVVQVQTGREQAACEAIARASQEAGAEAPTGDKLLHECFAPRYETQVKVHGQWHREQRLVLSGYVVAVTDSPWELARVLRGVPGFTKLLTMGEAFAPLSDADRAWIERWTREGDRTIPMSFAYKEGDKVVITEGPLVGQEAMITRVNRRKSVAHLEIHAGQMTIRTTVGLGVLPKPEDVQAKA